MCAPSFAAVLAAKMALHGRGGDGFVGGWQRGKGQNARTRHSKPAAHPPPHLGRYDVAYTAASKRSRIWRPSLVRVADTRDGALPVVQKPAQSSVVTAPESSLHAERRQARPAMGVQASPSPVQLRGKAARSQMG